ncbi:MAG TPA: YcnI family protein [Solirubrobacteraceae bacterium]|nr:YcnI family protein [Solirubrobacteraceae bacterium]
MKTINKIIVFASCTTIALLTYATSALAHISIHPNTVPAGAFATLDVRVPGEQQGAHVSKVDVLFPAGFSDVDYEAVPGWSVKVIERKLATPVRSDGETIDSEIAQLVWTWTGPLGEVSDGQFVQLPLSVAIPSDAAGKALEFRTVQSYSDGQVVHWIDPSLDAEHPSPRINVTAKGGTIEDVAGDEAGPVAGQTSATPSGGVDGESATARSSSGGSSKGLALAALIVGALALLAALFALLSARRGRKPRA